MKFAKPLAILLLVVMTILDGYQVYRIAFVRHEADFPAYLAGAEGLKNGSNPYEPTAIPPYSSSTDIRPFIYPLFIAWLWIPFTFLTPVAASFLWYFLSVALLVYSLYLCSKLLGITGNQTYVIGGVIGLLFVSILQWDFMFGQIDLLVLALLLLATMYLMRNSERSALYLGAAISAKLMPVVVLPMLLKLGTRAVLLSIATVLVLCIGIPYLFAGNQVFHYYYYWFRHTILTDVQNGDNSILSFSLSGVIAQLLGLTHQPAILKVGCGLFLLSFPLLLLYKKKTLPALFLSFLLIPLTSSRSERHHLIMLIPAVMLLASTLLQRKIFWQGREVALSVRASTVGWTLLVLIQLMILWGYDKPIPFDTMGMLMIFGLVFWNGQSLSSLHGNETVHGRW